MTEWNWGRALGAGLQSVGQSLEEREAEKRRAKLAYDTWLKQQGYTEAETIFAEGRAQRYTKEAEKRHLEDQKDLMAYGEKIRSDMDAYDNSPEVQALVGQSTSPTATPESKLLLASYLNARKKLSNLEVLNDQDWVGLSKLHPQIQTKIMGDMAQIMQFNKQMEAMDVYRNFNANARTTTEKRVTGAEAFDQERILTDKIDTLQKEQATILSDPKYMMMGNKLARDAKGNILPPANPKETGIYNAYLAKENRLKQINQGIADLELKVTDLRSGKVPGGGGGEQQPGGGNKGSQPTREQAIQAWAEAAVQSGRAKSTQEAIAKFKASSKADQDAALLALIGW